MNDRIILMSDYRRKHQHVPTGSNPVPRTRAPFLFVVGILLLGVLLAKVSKSQDGEAQIRNLPSGLRETLLRKTLEEVEFICASANAAVGQLRDHCVSQARFLLSFPECQAACQTAVFAVLPHSHR